MTGLLDGAFILRPRDVYRSVVRCFFPPDTPTAMTIYHPGVLGQ
jgi:hypothetical protein